MKFNCIKCSKEFNAIPSSKRKFCSYKCYWTALKEEERYRHAKRGVYLNCMFCNKSYYVVNCRKNKSKFCSYSCKAKKEKPRRKGPYPTGKNHPMWKGGKIINTQGYVMIRNTKHPYSDSHGYIREHRIVLEKHLGRHLEADEVVHHKNGNKQDNHFENLEIMGRAEHLKLHPDILDKARKALIGKSPAPHKAGCKCFRCTKITRSIYP